MTSDAQFECMGITGGFDGSIHYNRKNGVWSFDISREDIERLRELWAEARPYVAEQMSDWLEPDEPAFINAQNSSENEMSRLGYVDVQQTGWSDSYDLVATNPNTGNLVLGEVKDWARPVCSTEVEKLRNLAESDGAEAIFFSTSGYTSGAIQCSRGFPQVELYERAEPRMVVGRFVEPGWVYVRRE